MTSPDTRKILMPTDAPTPRGPYSPGVIKGGLVATAGQVGRDPESDELADGLEAQVRQTLRNVEAVLEAAGTGWHGAIKANCFLANLSDVAEFNRIYAEVVPSPRPARTTVGAALAPGVLVEIDVLAFLEQD